ncbi:MAG: AarF/ABC1/UbiB kinase family protein, partial [Actinomycetia bacterium]|nr:AarF/ABC1/UbiB kinase family protein [Actinomycetes bacterium]
MSAETDEPTDMVHGTFSSSPPWLVDPDQMAWRRDVENLREGTRRTVPELVKARKFPPAGRLVETAGRFGWSVLRWRLGAGRKGGSKSKADLSHRLRISAEHLGPTYIKLAQIISAGEGVFPDELVDELKKCRDQVKPEPFDTVRATLERELGRPPEHIFDWISPDALAAASIAQVHEARLRTGEEVVIKVQRSTVGELVGKDLRTLAWLAPFLIG